MKLAELALLHLFVYHVQEFFVLELEYDRAVISGVVVSPAICKACDSRAFLPTSKACWRKAVALIHMSVHLSWRENSVCRHNIIALWRNVHNSVKIVVHH